MRNLYERLVHSPYFAGIVSSCFIAYALLFIAVMVFGLVHVGQIKASQQTIVRHQRSSGKRFC